MVKTDTFFNKLYDLLKNDSNLSEVEIMSEINNFMITFLSERQFEEIFSGKYKKRQSDDTLRFSNLLSNHFTVEKDDIPVADDVDEKLLKDMYSVYEHILTTYPETKAFKEYNLGEIDEHSLFTSISKKKFKVYTRLLYNILREFRLEFFGTDEMTDEVMDNFFDNYDFVNLSKQYETFKMEMSYNVFAKKSKKKTKEEKPNIQMYVPQEIVDHCVNYLEPTNNESVYNPNLTSGSFLHGLTSYMTKTSPKHVEKFRGNIYGGNYESIDTMKSLFVELLLHDFDIDNGNIYNSDSLAEEKCSEYFQRFDTAIGMMPHANKNIITLKDFNSLSVKVEGEDVKLDYNYWNSISKGKSLFKDSTGQYLLHVINSLKDNGRFSLVINRSILNGGKAGSESYQKKVRHWLLACCDIEEMVMLPKNTFNNLKSEFCIISGVKKVPFDDINEQASEKKKFSLKTSAIKVFMASMQKAKGSSVATLHINEKPNFEISKNELIENDYSLNIATYHKVETKTSTATGGIECINFESVCDLENGTSLPKTKIEDGPYAVISSGRVPVAYHKESNRPKGAILCAKSGKDAGYVSRHTGKVWAAESFSIEPKHNDLNKKYLF